MGSPLPMCFILIIITSARMSHFYYNIGFSKSETKHLFLESAKCILLWKKSKDSSFELKESAFGVEASAKIVFRVDEENLFVCHEDCKNGFVNSNGVEGL